MADDQYEQLAVAGYQRTGNQVNDDFLPKLNGKQGRRILRQMAENDETIGGVLFAMNSVYRSVQWIFDPADPENPEAVKYAEWLENAIEKQMGDPEGALPDDTWSAFVQTWTDTDVFGWSWYDVWIKQLPDGSVGIARLVPVAAETLDGWYIDEPTGYVRGIFQRSPTTAVSTLIPRERSLHLISSPNKGNPEGLSILRTAYRPWYYKKVHLEIEAILAERGTGFPVITVNSDIKKAANDPNLPEAQRQAAQAMIDDFEGIVARVKRNEQSGMVVYSKPYISGFDPETGVTTYGSEQQVKLEFLTPEQSNAVDIDRTIKRLDTSIARALLADFMFFGTGGNTGNQANLGNRTELWIRAMQSRIDSNVECINRQLIPQLWKLNAFPDELRPVIRAGSISKDSIETLTTALARLAQAGAPVFPDPELQEFVYKEAGLPTKGIDKTGEKLPSIED
jgi:hypothetical protein